MENPYLDVRQSDGAGFRWYPKKLHCCVFKDDTNMPEEV